MAESGDVCHILDPEVPGSALRSTVRIEPRSTTCVALTKAIYLQARCRFFNS